MCPFLGAGASSRNLLAHSWTYREFHLLANLGWVDFDSGCSTILLGQ